MQVGKRMTTSVVTVQPRDRIDEARALFSRHGIRHLPVVEYGRLVGMVAERDLRMAEAVGGGAGPLLIADIMTGNLISVGTETSIERAAMLIADNKIGALPVVNDEDEVVGIITQSDILNVFLEVMGVGPGTARLELALDDRPGAIFPVAEAFARTGLNIVSVVTIRGEGDKKVVIVRVERGDLENALAALEVSGVDVVSVEEGSD